MENHILSVYTIQRFDADGTIEFQSKPFYSLEACCIEARDLSDNLGSDYEVSIWITNSEYQFSYANFSLDIDGQDLDYYFFYINGY